MNQPDFDPQLTIAVIAGALTEEQAEDYKRGNKKYKPIRDIFKNGNYALNELIGHIKLREFRETPERTILSQAKENYNKKNL